MGGGATGGTNHGRHLGRRLGYNQELEINRKARGNFWA